MRAYTRSRRVTRPMRVITCGVLHGTLRGTYASSVRPPPVWCPRLGRVTRVLWMRKYVLCARERVLYAHERAMSSRHGAWYLCKGRVTRVLCARARVLCTRARVLCAAPSCGVRALGA